MHRVVSSAWAWLLLLVMCLAAPGAAAADEIVKEITFRGLRRVEPDAVRLVMSLREGQPLDPRRVADDIRAIYAMGYFRDVQVFKEDVEGGVRVLFEVAEKASIRKIEIRGNDGLSQDDIKNVLDLRPFTIANDAKIKRNQQKIKDLYAEKGYYLAEVTTRLESVSPTEVVVVFDIVENAKVQVRKIRLVGNQQVSDSLIKGSLQTREGDLLSFLSESGTYRADAFQVDLLRISHLYFDRGYINVKVDAPEVELSSDRKHLYLTIRIEEGEQYSVGKLDFSGDLIEPKEQLAKLIQSEEGEIFNRSQLANDLLALKTRYEDDGYAYANITPVTSIDASKRLISITFDVQQGQKVYYERINVVGNAKTRDKVIRRELRIYEGELTSASKREQSKRRVMALGYFEKAEVKTRKGSRDDLQIVDIEVKERATGTFQIGAGFSSAEQFVATAQISQENFLGRGQSVAITAQISAIRQQFRLAFVEPYFLDTRWTLQLDAHNREDRFRSILRTSSGGEIWLGHPLTDELSMFLTYGLEFVQSRGEDGLFQQPAYASLNSKGRISSLRATIQYDTRNNRIFPSDGMYHSLSAEISHRFIGSSETREFERYRLISRYYYPFGLGIVGRAAARVGLLHTASELGLAPSEKFLLGGIGSIRGYLPFSIGPERLATRNDRGTQLFDPLSSTAPFNEGGNKEIVLNLEVEFPIFEEVGIRGVLFMDAGNAYGEDENYFYLGGKARALSTRGNESFDPNSLPLGLYWSVGFGFRWFSPIGPLRFEWGIPLTRRPTDSKGPLFEFSIGNTF